MSECIEAFYTFWAEMGEALRQLPTAETMLKRSKLNAKTL